MSMQSIKERVAQEIQTEQEGYEPSHTRARASTILDRIFRKPDFDAEELRRYHDTLPEDQRNYGALDRVEYLINRHRKNPQLDHTRIDTLPRSMISNRFITEDELKQLGFVNSMIAVPERGQSQIASLRHPKSNLHLHKHDKNWVYHIDDWPSMSMQRMKSELTGNPVNYGHGIQHAVLEGVPGYYNYALGNILGGPTFPELIRNPSLENTSSPLRKTIGLTAAIGTPALLAALINSKDRGGAALNTAGTVGGGIGGLMLAQALRNQASKNVSTNPWVRFLADTAGLTGGAYLGYKATQRKKKDDEK
jgi:hypothetical protein